MANGPEKSAKLETIQAAVRAAQAVTFKPSDMAHMGVEDLKRWTDVYNAVQAIAAAAGL